MKFRKLRIAWSVGCGVACLLLIALWIRGYWIVDIIGRGYYVGSEETLVAVRSGNGTLTFDRRTAPASANEFPGLTDTWTRRKVTPKPGIRQFMWRNNSQEFRVHFPAWIPVILLIVVGVVPSLRLKRKTQSSPSSYSYDADFGDVGVAHLGAKLLPSNSRLRFGKLRIAFSAVCGIGCLLLFALCVRSFWIGEQTDQSFGYSQVEQVIQDRPEMGPIINSKPALRAMLESSFEGEQQGGRIHWDCAEPSGGSSAEHLWSHDEQPALVRVSNRPAISAVDKCMMLVFELLNTQFDNGYKAHGSMAINRQISREDFARSCIRLELAAGKKTQEFFQRHPIADANALGNPEYTSLMAYSHDFSDYLQWLDEPDVKHFDIREYYRQVYDRLLFDSER